MVLVHRIDRRGRSRPARSISAPPALYVLGLRPGGCLRLAAVTNLSISVDAVRCHSRRRASSGWARLLRATATATAECASRRNGTPATYPARATSQVAALSGLYDRLILNHPVAVLLPITTIVIFLAWHCPVFPVECIVRIADAGRRCRASLLPRDPGTLRFRGFSDHMLHACRRLVRPDHTGGRGSNTR